MHSLSAKFSYAMRCSCAVVAGLPIVASQLNATHADLNVVLTAPDGGISLADQVLVYANES
jgi:hypothetical protein